MIVLRMFIQINANWFLILIKEHVDTLVNNYSDVTEVINIDDFSSGNKGWVWG